MLADWLRSTITLPFYCLGMWFLVRSSVPDFGWASVPLGLLVWVVYTMYATQNGPENRIASVLARSVARGSHEKPTPEFTLILAQKGVTVAEPERSWAQGWSNFARVISLPECAVLENADLYYSVVIPHNAFSSKEVQEQFIQQARLLHDGSGHGEHDQVRAEIEALDLACPSCGYMLKGSSGTTCSECGQQLTPGALRAAAVLRQPLWRLVLTKKKEFAGR